MGARRPTTLCGGTGDTMSSQALLSRTLQDLVRHQTPISVQRYARCVDNRFEPAHEIIDSPPQEASRFTIDEKFDMTTVHTDNS